MTGLNPDGLGRNRSFDSTEHESVNTESASIGPNGERTIEYDSELGTLVVIQ